MQGRKAPSGIDHLNSKLFPYNRAFRRSLHPSAVVSTVPATATPVLPPRTHPTPPPKPQDLLRAPSPKGPPSPPTFACERPRDQMDTNAKISKNPEKILAKIAEKSPFDSAALKAIEIMGARPVHAFMFGCLDVLMMMTLQYIQSRGRAPSSRASRSPSSSGSALCSQGRARSPSRRG